MKKSKPVDKILNGARKRAIEKAYLPRTIEKTYNVCIKDGTVVLTKKKH